MNKIEKDILRKVKEHHKGRLSPADMINGIAHRDEKAVEHLMIYGYLEQAPEYISRRNGNEKFMFYRITEKGLNMFEPLHKRIWFFIRGDLRVIFVSVITSIIITILTSLLLKYL